jgi:outer membrane murein-binding lipoprotein Lpp
MAEKSSVEKLNHFLRGEISAVETYRMALAKLDQTSTARAELDACLQSHQSRVVMLREAIRAAGGTPAEGSGPWGMFAKAVEGGAQVLGEKATVAALEEGEDHGVKDYKTDVNDLDASLQSLVMSRLAPEQQRTHDRMSSLKKRLAAQA